jgi:hypothetical protein
LPDGSIGQKKGKWVNLPMRKKQVTVTGDITNSTKFEVEGCPIPAPKFNLQASQQSIFLPQQAMQYNHLRYLGGPVSFDTEEIEEPFNISVVTDQGCGGFRNVEAYLTAFNFSYTPPSPPTAQYTMEALFSICPGSC